MRKEFIECESEKEAYEICPWASFSIKVVGGFWMFESESDYDMFLNQN